MQEIKSELEQVAAQVVRCVPSVNCKACKRVSIVVALRNATKAAPLRNYAPLPGPKSRIHESAEGMTTGPPTPSGTASIITRLGRAGALQTFGLNAKSKVLVMGCKRTSLPRPSAASPTMPASTVGHAVIKPLQ